jgi:hypothetical protein
MVNHAGAMLRAQAECTRSLQNATLTAHPYATSACCSTDGSLFIALARGTAALPAELIATPTEVLIMSEALLRYCRTFNIDVQPVATLIMHVDASDWCTAPGV